MGISVVIPILEGDLAWKNLIPDLAALSAEDEVIFVSTGKQLEAMAKQDDLLCSQKFVASIMGRAKQLNAGVEQAAGEFVWFLHCDSRVSDASIAALKVALQRNPSALFFFDLQFAADGPSLMWLSELGVRFRSRFLRLPFGDQGFCVSRQVFARLAGFAETAPYGEDHLLVWRAHQEGVPLVAVGAPLLTSARRYKNFGWARTTAKHLGLTAWQAAPEFIRLLRRKVAL